jgi:DNA repair protein RadC
LIGKFGSVTQVVNANIDQLQTALGPDGDLAPLIEGARNLIEAGLRESISRSVVAVDDRDLQAYLLMCLKDRPEEHIHVIFVNDAGHYIRDERLFTGSSSQVSARLRQLFQRSFELGARGLILAHNHPSGSVEPSEEDQRSTRHISAMAAALDLFLIDHLIVAGAELFSIKRGCRL